MMSCTEFDIFLNMFVKLDIFQFAENQQNSTIYNIEGTLCHIKLDVKSYHNQITTRIQVLV